jgi:hypothetical protein
VLIDRGRTHHRRSRLANLRDDTAADDSVVGQQATQEAEAGVKQVQVWLAAVAPAGGQGGEAVRLQSALARSRRAVATASARLEGQRRAIRAGRASPPPPPPPPRLRAAGAVTPRCTRTK